MRRRNFRLEISSLELSAGITHVRGANGAGKSSLLSTVVGGKSRRMRSLEWQGTAVTGRLAVREFRRQLGYVPQEPLLPLAWRVEDYLRFAARARGLDQRVIRESVMNAAAVLDLDDAQLDRRIGSLSGGWRRRVHICQALLGDPRVLVMDEPFSGLDQHAVGLIRAFLASVAGDAGRVVLLADHSNSLEEVPRVEIALANGRVR